MHNLRASRVLSVTRLFATVFFVLAGGAITFVYEMCHDRVLKLHNAAKTTEETLSNLEISFFGPPRSTLGPLLGPEFVPKSSKVAPKDPPSAPDSGEPVPGGRKYQSHCVYHLKQHPAGTPF